MILYLEQRKHWRFKKCKKKAGLKFHLKKKIKKWLHNNQIKYIVLSHDDRPMIIFDREQDAVEFLLSY